MKIKLHTKAPKCPKCKVGIRFEQHQFKDTKDKYSFLNCGPALYRCPKCLNLYEVTIFED